MSKDSQLTLRADDPRVTQTLVAQHDQQVALATVRALAQSLDTPRKILTGKTTERLMFQKVGPIVLKIQAKFVTHDLMYNPARNEIVSYTPPEPEFLASICSEGDLLDLEKDLAMHGSGRDRVEFREWLKAARAEPAAPLEIKITNAREVGAVDKVISIKRDDSGKLSGATSMPIS
jgi:hypothetical protein